MPVLQHVLPKGFRRSRNYGFLHANSKRLITLLKLLAFKLVPPIAAIAASARPPARKAHPTGVVAALTRK